MKKLDPKTMKDWEIALEAEDRMKPIDEVAQSFGIEKSELFPYGHFMESSIIGRFSNGIKTGLQEIHRSHRHHTYPARRRENYHNNRSYRGFGEARKKGNRRYTPAVRGSDIQH